MKEEATTQCLSVHIQTEMLGTTRSVCLRDRLPASSEHHTFVTPSDKHACHSLRLATCANCHLTFWLYLTLSLLSFILSLGILYILSFD